jgi:DNA polymerase-3 subunit epsilon
MSHFTSTSESSEQFPQGSLDDGLKGEKFGHMLDQVLIIDTETTGLKADKDQVIEVAGVLYSVNNQTTIQQVSTLLPAGSNPAERINRIKPGALRNITGELADPGMSMLTRMAQKAELIVAHNAEFDKKWFGIAIKGRSILPTLKNANGQPLSWVCTCSDFEWPYQTRSGQSLVELALAHGIGVSTNHRALTDCQLIAALFDRMENLPAMFDRALRPKACFKALVSYDDKDVAKQAGFKWFAERKSWERIMAVEDTKELPFKVKQISATQHLTQQMGHLEMLSSNSPAAIAS